MVIELTNEQVLWGASGVGGFIAMISRFFWGRLVTLMRESREESEAYRVRLHQDIDALRAELRECYQSIYQQVRRNERG